MHVLFLDIDGVLNHEKLLDQRMHEHRTLVAQEGPAHYDVCMCIAQQNNIDPECVKRLNTILRRVEENEKQKLRVVISSSWRKLVDPPEMLRVLKLHGFEGEIIGETPDLPNDEQWLEEMATKHGGYLDHEDKPRPFGDVIINIKRGDEIAEWMRRNPGVTRFVILDDVNDMGDLKHRHVITNPDIGLSDEDVELAVNMMSWDGRAV